MSHEKNAILAELHKVSLKTFATEKKQRVITLQATDTIEKAVKVLGDNKILGAPVVGKDGKVIDIIDMSHIVGHICRASPTPYSLARDELGSLKIAGRAIALVTLQHMLDQTDGRDPLVEVFDDQTLATVAELLGKGLHRTVIFSKETKQPVAIVSQSDICRWLAVHLNGAKFEKVAKRTLKDYGFAAGDGLVTITEKQNVLYALNLLEKNKVGAVAVVDAQGHLTGNFSASDLRGLYQENFPGLLREIGEYLDEFSPKSRSPRAILATSTLLEAVQEISQSKLHRLWIIDDFKPIGVITLTDVMKIISA